MGGTFQSAARCHGVAPLEKSQWHCDEHSGIQEGSPDEQKDWHEEDNVWEATCQSDVLKTATSRLSQNGHHLFASVKLPSASATASQ